MELCCKPIILFLFLCGYCIIAESDLSTRTHNGARIKFGNEFIKTGLIDKKYGKLYSKLFDYRQKGDYGDLFDFDCEIVLPLVDKVKEFIEEINKHINK